MTDAEIADMNLPRISCCAIDGSRKREHERALTFDLGWPTTFTGRGAQGRVRQEVHVRKCLKVLPASA